MRGSLSMQTSSTTNELSIMPVTRYGPLDSDPVDFISAQRQLAAGCVVILDVQPTDIVMSDRPFRIRVKFAAPTAGDGVISVVTSWAGLPFTVERRIGIADHERGYVDVEFTDKQTLPTGRATFTVGIITELGSQADFTLTCAVLP